MYISHTKYRYLTALLSLGWRKRMTEHLSSLYFSNNAFYKVRSKFSTFSFLKHFLSQVFHLSENKVDADQRVTQDVEKLGADISGLVTGMVKPSVDILW